MLFRSSYRYGFPKPALIHTESGIAWSAVPPQVPGTKYNPLSIFLSLPYERSELLAATVDQLFSEYGVAGDSLTAVHPNAADENEIVDWTLRKFSSFKIKNKVLLLQYTQDTTNTTDVAEEKKLVLRIANELSLKVVDTSTVLKNYEASELWYTIGLHHTPFGNKVVCSYLFEEGF